MSLAWFVVAAYSGSFTLMNAHHTSSLVLLTVNCIAGAIGTCLLSSHSSVKHCMMKANSISREDVPF